MATPSGAFSGRGVSPEADLTFSSSELKCASIAWLNAPMREYRVPDSGVDMMRRQLSQWQVLATRRVQRGQGLVEYALIIVLISIAAVLILQTLGSSISVLYSAANVMTAP